MIKMSRKAKKAMAVALTAGMLASTAATPVMAATEGWKKNSTGWWYQNADGSWPANKWEFINGSWYYFDANGYMKANSWAQDSAGKWYYLGVNGAMKVNSWAQDASGKWYFVGADGAMKANSWAQDASGKWYFLGADGAMVTNTWAKDKNALWYYLGADGVMEAGKWITTGDKSYFLAADGVMQSGIITVDGKTYYLGAADDGSRKTGEIEIAGTKYNFGADGACTDETAPAAAKHFDAKGNVIIPEIEVEQVAGITGEIVNAIPDYKEKYGNVLIAGNDAYLKVLVTDAKGKPVANTAVSLKTKYETGDKGVFDNKGLDVQNTDANGYATFAIGTEDSDITPTSGKNALLSLTATVVATNQTYETTVAFASVDPGTVNVINHDYHDDALLEVPSTNYHGTLDVAGNIHNVAYSTSLGKKSVEYVFSQQVNDKGSDANKVEIEIDPTISIPVMGNKVVSDYYQEINKEITEYSVYEDGTTASFRIDDIPKGLLYATLNVSATDISAYTQVNFKLYNKDTDKLLNAYTKKGAWSQKDFGYEIPLQGTNCDMYMIVEVVSEGQVNDNQNAGLTIKDIEGVYDTKEVKGGATEHLTDCVTWSVVKNKYSDTRTLDSATAKAYIGGYDPKEEKYLASGNKYTYQVPVFPYTGNAVLTVTDKNDKVVGYFTISTENAYDSVKKVYKNENVLEAAGVADVVLVSENEAFDNVGTIETKGNKVIVNSDKSGVTALQAKLDLPGFEEQIDASNNTLYTSVQWAPVLNEVESNDFYALVGQNIVVTAQLVDNQGNPVSGNSDLITFTYDNVEVPQEGAIGSTGVTVVSKDTQTNAKGQAVLKLNSGDAAALLSSLEASTSKYNVVLTIGGENVEKANLRWVNPGLSFTTAPKDVYNDSTLPIQNTDWLVVDTLSKKIGDLSDSNKELFEKALAKETGKEWIFGYEVIGETQDANKTNNEGKTDIDVLAIEGLKVDISKSAKGDLVTEGMPNGVVKVKSSENGGTKLKGTINKDSIVSGTDVYFYVDVNDNGKIDSNEKYKNVGVEGTPSFDQSLELPITWGIEGQQLELVSPKGKNFAVNAGDEVYVKLGDAFGDAIGSTKLDKVTVTYTKKDGTTIVDPVANPTTSPEGLITIELRGDTDIKYVTITAKYGNVELTDNVITYKEVSAADKTDFALVNAVYTVPTSGQPAVIEAIFNHAVDKGSISKEMFSIDGVMIDKVEVDNNKVKITLANETKELSANDVHTLSVELSKTVDGITYAVCDNNGNSLTDKLDDKNNDSVAKINFNTLSKGTKVTATYNGATEIDLKATNQMDTTAAKNNFVVVYTGKTNVASALPTQSVKLVPFSADGTATLTVGNTAAWDGDITIYYNGGSYTLSKDTLNATKTAAEKKAAIDALKADSTVTSSTTAPGAPFAPSVSGWTVKSITVTPANNAAESSLYSSLTGTTTLNAKDSLPGTGTETVTVVYTHSTITGLEQSIVYTATSNGSQISYTK